MAVVQIGISPVSYRHIHAHAHDLWEIVYNFEGEGTTDIGSKEYRFYPGSIICQPPNTLHTKNAERGFRDIFLQTDRFPLGDTKCGPMLFEDDRDQSFFHLLSLAHRVYHKQENNSRALVEALYDAMYQLLLSWSAASIGNAEVVRVKDLLVASFSDPEFTTAALMENTAYCRDHFRKLFKKETGCTPGAYLQKLRIGNAQKLLANNGMLHLNIEEIAQMSGFYDPHYFHRLFKKETGCTPRQYQQQKAKKS